MADQFAGLDDAVGSVLKQSTGTSATAIRNNLQFSLDANPDKEAGIQHLARFVGLPTETVRAQPDAVKTQAALQQFDADHVANNYPGTSKVLSTLDNTRMLHDDIPNMVGLEAAIRSVAPSSTLDDLKNVPMAGLQGLGGAFNSLAKNANLALGAFPVLADKLTGGTGAQDWWFKNMVAPLDQRQAAFQLAPNAGMASKTAHAVGGLLGTLSQIELGGTAGAAEALPATASGADALTAAVQHAIRAMAIPSTSSAIETGQNVYQNTSDPLASIKAALAQYAVTTEQGVLPLSAPGGLLGRMTGGALSFPLTSELGRQQMNSVLPSSMQQQFDPQEAVVNAVLGAVMGGAMGPRPEPNLQAAIRKTYTDAAKADSAVRAADMLQTLGDLASASKFRERDAEQFKQFISDVADRNGAPDLYVDAKTFAQVLDQSGVKAEELMATMPRVAEQMREGLVTDGMVKIPLEDYAAHVAGSPVDEALREHLRTDPEGMTLAEATNYYQDQAARMKETAEQVVGAKAQDDAFKASGQQVEDYVKGELDKANRFPPDVNKAYAAMWRAFFDTTASRTGMLPHELLDTYGAEVRGDQLPGGDRTLDQSSRFGEDNRLSNLNPNGASWERIRENNPALAKLGPDDDVTIYRATIGNEIRPDDFVAVDKSTLRTELKNVRQRDGAAAKVISKKVKVRDLLMGNDATEFVYYPEHEPASNTYNQNVEDYQIDHKPMTVEGGAAQLHDLTTAFGEDIYGRNALQYFGSGDPREAEVLRILKSVRDKPDAKVTIYRGVPAEAEGINAGDWVTLSKKAAQDYADQHEGGKVVSKEVPASHVTSWADSLLEFGYHPEGNTYNQGATPLKEGQTHVDVDGVQRHALNSSGKPIAATEEGVRNFWRWFGDSKVVDKDGKPLVVYHGSPADFSTFDPSKSGEKSKTGAPEGTFFFADRPDVADSYNVAWQGDFSKEYHPGANIMPVHLALQKPLKVNAKGDSWRYIEYKGELRDINEIAQIAKESGKYDGVIVSRVRDKGRGALDSDKPSTTYIAFKPEQIKSAVGNSGAFDPANPSILHQNARGQIAFGKDITQEPSVISLLKNADLSTFLHESGHFFLEVHSDLASKLGADHELSKDFQKTLDWFGVKDVDSWRNMTADQKRTFHEQFARGFEQYLMEGKAPTTELQTLFGRFRSWLVNVYKQLSALNVQLTPDVRGVMDRMLASEEAIKQSEQARSLMPLFDAKPEGMTDGAWAKYQAENQQATEDAIIELQRKSINDMRWLSNAKDKAIRALQREAKEQRSTIREEVTQQVDKMPVYQAERWLRKGEMTAPDGSEVKAEKGFRLNTDDLKAMFPEGALERPDMDRLRGMTSKDGLHPDMVAEMFGFDSGDQLVRELINMQPRKDVIEGMTDQRMLQEHGELVDERSIERAAEAAIHNDVRTRVLARELTALAKATGSPRLLAKAAGEAADAAINAKQVKDINPRQYQVAEGKAGKAANDAWKKGDTEAAAMQKRAQLLNNQLAKKAAEAQEDVRKILTYMKRFDRVSTLKAINTEERGQILELLKNYDFRKNPTDEPTRAQRNLQQWLESQQMAGYSPMVADEALRSQPRTQYRDMKMEDLRGLYDTVRSIEKVGKDKLQADWRGERVALDELVRNEFIPKMQERGDNFTADQLYNREENRSASSARLALDRMAGFMRAMFSELKPQYFKANHFDQHEILGPFHELFNQVFEANYRKIDLTRAQSDRARELASQLGKDWQRSTFDKVPNDTLIDMKASEEAGRPVMLSLTRDNLIQMAAHAGNESNFDKLVKGYGWQPEDVWKFLDGKLTAKDVQAVKAEWEMANQHWDDVKAMYERMGQVVPPKIEPRPYKLRLADGTVEDMPGGYMPIRYDPLRSRLGAKKQAERAIDPETGRFGYDFFGRDTTTNGSMNARQDGYTDAIDLSHATFERALAETVHDLAYRETLVNVNKIISHRDFREQFYKTYGREDYDALHTWLGRIANAENMDRQVGALGRVLRYTRTGMVMNAIALRVSTVLKHGGSAAIKTMGYFVGGGEKYYLARQSAMAMDYKAQMNEALEKFPEIRARAMQQDRDYRATVSSLFTQEKLQSKAERFGHAAVAWADLFTAVATAHAAYDRAVAEGIPKDMGGTGAPMSHEDAVRYANQIVREAHGSQIETARSNIMTNPHEGVKMFTTLYGFMNNTLGQTADIIDKMRTTGINRPETLARAFMALIVPSLWAGMLTDGVPTKEDWEKWLAKALGSETLGMFPFARDAFAFLEGYRHAGVVGVESWMQSVLQPAIDVTKAAQGKEVSGAISHAADAAGMGLHIPGLGQLGKSAQYLYDVHTGKQQPQSTAEMVQGATVGVHKQH